MYPIVTPKKDYWKVKLGAGIWDIDVTEDDLIWLDSMSLGTASLPPRFYSVEEFQRFIDAVIAVKKYLAEKAGV